MHHRILGISMVHNLPSLWRRTARGSPRAPRNIARRALVPLLVALPDCCSNRRVRLLKLAVCHEGRTRAVHVAHARRQIGRIRICIILSRRRALARAFCTRRLLRAWSAASMPPAMHKRCNTPGATRMTRPSGHGSLQEAERCPQNEDDVD